MVQKEKVATTYGDIEFEIETCDSCGNEMLKGEGTPFTIGTGTDKVKGVACGICYDTGPVSFPEKVRSKIPYHGMKDGPDESFMTELSMFPLLFMISVIIYPFEGDVNKEYVVGYSNAIWQMLIWSAIIVALYVAIIA